MSPIRLKLIFIHFVQFDEGELVMVSIRPKCFPKGKFEKLHSQNADPYKILKKIIADTCRKATI